MTRELELLRSLSAAVRAQRVKRDVTELNIAEDHAMYAALDALEAFDREAPNRHTVPGHCVVCDGKCMSTRGAFPDAGLPTSGQHVTQFHARWFEQNGAELRLQFLASAWEATVSWSRLHSYSDSGGIHKETWSVSRTHAGLVTAVNGAVEAAIDVWSRANPVSESLASEPPQYHTLGHCDLCEGECRLPTGGGYR